jgi:tetratricopeptide (TPR) repeat protein
MENVTIELVRETDGSVRSRASSGRLELVAHVAAAHEMDEITKDVRTLFGESDNNIGCGSRPLGDPIAWRELGHALRDVFFGAFFDKVVDSGRSADRSWLFSSQNPEALNLPWELLPGPGRSFIVADGRTAIRRTTRADLAESGLALVAPPLRILFTACAPVDLPGLDYEKEEEAMLRVASRLGSKVHLDIAEAGTFDELRELISEFQPHVLHLSGHGAMRNGVGHFAFEDERGKSDLHSGEELAEMALAGRGVRMVFVSGCETAQAGVAGVCQALTTGGHVSVALGWGSSIADSLATEFSRTFYHELASGRPIDDAVNAARRELLERCRFRHGPTESLDGSFALPRLYASDHANEIVDQRLASDPPPRRGVEYDLLGDGITGLKEGFVGRRRVLQRARPALRDGDKKIVILTGIGGAGKSTLATRLANRCRLDRFEVISLKARKETAAQFGLRLVQQLAVKLQFDEGARGLASVLQDGQQPLASRLLFAVEILNRQRFLLVLDNLEALMPSPPGPRIWADEYLRQFFENLFLRLTGAGRAILTCRYLPESLDASLPNLLHEALPDFTEADFFKYLSRHAHIAQRIEAGEFTRALLTEFHRKLGGTPRFIEQACRVLERLDGSQLAAQLAGLDDPDAGEGSDLLREKQQDYFRQIFLPELYDALSPADRAALSRFAVLETPAPLDAFASISALPESDAEAAISHCLSLGLLQRFGDTDEVQLYAIYPLQRSFLTDPARLPQQSKAAAHDAAAAFFKDCYERDREAELRLAVGTELFAALHHAQCAGNLDLQRWAVGGLCAPLFRAGEYRAILELVAPLLDQQRHPDMLEIAGRASIYLGQWPYARELFMEALRGYEESGNRKEEAVIWHQLASIDLKEGQYAAAREKLAKSLETSQAIGDRAGEAGSWHQLAIIDVYEGQYAAAREKTAKSLEIEQAIRNRAGEAGSWHQLASIDLNEGQYAAAREKLAKSLAVRQAIGDRAGEAATLYQLGALAWKQGRHRPGACLVAICWSIESSINDAGQQETLPTLSQMRSALKLDQAGFDALVNEATGEYQRDRAADLIKKALDG